MIQMIHNNEKKTINVTFNFVTQFFEVGITTIVVNGEFIWWNFPTSINVYGSCVRRISGLGGLSPQPEKEV